MLARTYADWLTRHEPTDASRAAIIGGLLECARRLCGLNGDARLGGADVSSLRIGELARTERAWPLSATADELFAALDEGRSGSADSLARRLACAHVLGEALDILYGVETAGRGSGAESHRRRSGSYFTPRSVARSLVAESLEAPHLVAARLRQSLWICDPAMGGGAFLLEAVAGLTRAEVAAGREVEETLARVGRTVCGYDQNELAVATAEAALFLLTGLSDWKERLLVADSLMQTPLPTRWADRMQRTTESEAGFDWIIGNPPWVSFQGRATQSLAAERRASLKQAYAAFSGYPTLHGAFAERATQLAPRGVVSLLLPSSLSDLNGYRAARSAVVRTHVPNEPLLEYGEDAFPGVVQPCFGLLACPRDGPVDLAPQRPWRLRERAHRGQDSEPPAIPSVLGRLSELPKLPRTCFGELGLQSNRRVTGELFLRATAPSAPFVEPLLEGRNVRAFQVDAPRLFLNADVRVLADARCRYRPASDYQRVDFVVRQTAPVTIAARHNGLRFRNSLLAGYGCAEFDPELLIGLLNSSLFRAFHASRQRDARQATFPQVKISHLRELPAPPDVPEARQRVAAVSTALSERGPSPEGVATLDAAVFDLYGVSASARREVTQFLTARFRPR